MKKLKHGEATLEYIIIIVLVALGALLVFAIFGERIGEKAGAVIEMIKNDNEGSSRN